MVEPVPNPQPRVSPPGSPSWWAHEGTGFQQESLLVVGAQWHGGGSVPHGVTTSDAGARAVPQ